MSSIRVRRAGLYYFTAQLLSYLITVLYTIYVARALPKLDYGLYGYILSLWMAVDVFKTGYNFWAGRMMARGKKCLKTLMLANLIVSIPTSIALLIIIFKQSNIYGELFTIIGTLSVIYILTSYLYGSLVRATGMLRPQLLGIDPILNSTLKIVVGIPLINYLGFTGALITLVIGNIVVSIALYRINREDVEDNVDFSLIKEWTKGAWYPILLALANVLIVNIQLIVLGIVEAVNQLPSYNMAFRASRFIQFAGAISIALVPALLKGRDPEKSVYNVLDLMLLVAVPVTLGLMIYPREVVYIFGWNKYIDAQIPLIILAASTFISLFNLVGLRSIIGLGDVDAYYTIDINRLIRSDMMKLVISMYISLALETITIILLYGEYGTVGLAFSHLVASATLFLLIGVRTIKMVNMRLLLVKTGKYVLAAALAIALIYFIPKYRSLYIGLSAAVAIAAYAAAIYLIDEDTRKLVKRIQEEVSLKL